MFSHLSRRTSISGSGTPWRDRIPTLVFPLTEERDRWFLWLPPLFGVGIATYFSLLTEPSWLTAMLPLLTAAALRWIYQERALVTLIVSLALIVAAGFLAAKIRTEFVRAPILSHPLKRAVVIGHVQRVEVRADQSKRLTLRVVKIDGITPTATPRRVRIRIRKGRQTISAGDTVQLVARLAPPPAIPRGYDFARAAYFQGLGGVGFAVSTPELVEPTKSLPLPMAFSIELQKLRQWIGRRIEHALPGEVGIMANALMTGERSGISQETNDLYRDAGIFHILSISGLHMAIMGGSVFIVLRFILAAMPPVALRFPIKKWAAASAAMATFAYLLISGGAHPTVRSFIMILIMFFAIMLDRPAIALRNVGLAALLILIVLPESLLNAGFQLSFAAVTSLVAAYEAHRARTQRRRRLGHVHSIDGTRHQWLRVCWLFITGTMATTVIAGLATAPFAAFHFHTSQQYAVLTNMLAIPVSNLLVMPAALAAFVVMPFGLEAWPLAVMGTGIELMSWSARQVTSMPGAVTAVPAFPVFGRQLMIAGGLWLCIWRQHWRWLGVPVAIIGIVAATGVEYPAALIGKNGELVALRDAQGQLAAAKARYGTYEYSRWLEADPRKPVQAWGRKPFRCDLEGCTGSIGKHLTALPRSPAALIDDCRRAAILILTFPKPQGCKTTATVFDYPLLRRHGTHALYIQPDATVRVETVEQFRGSRPWTLAARNAKRERPNQPNKHSTKPERQRIQPEIEGDGHPLYWFR